MDNLDDLVDIDESAETAGADMGGSNNLNNELPQLFINAVQIGVSADIAPPSTRIRQLILDDHSLERI